MITFENVVSEVQFNNFSFHRKVLLRFRDIQILKVVKLW